MRLRPGSTEAIEAIEVLEGIPAIGTVEAPPVAAPYAPGWVDALQARVSRLPWSVWVTCTGVWAALLAVEYTGQVLAGTANDAPWPFIMLAFALAPYSFAFMDFLDRTAAAALDRLGEPPSASSWPGGALYHLTTKPVFGTAVATAAGLTFGLVQRYGVTAPYLERLGFARSGWLHYYELVAVPMTAWSLIGVLIYHVLRQVGIVRRIYRELEDIDVFSVRRFQAFSAYSALMALGVLAVVYLWLAVYPDVNVSSVERLNVAAIVLLSGLGFVVFLLPLWGAHLRLAAAREQRIVYVTRLLDSVLGQVHTSVEAGRNPEPGSGSAHETIKTLTAELQLVERASTWPWEASLFRGFATAVLLPLALYVAQQVLGRIF